MKAVTHVEARNPERTMTLAEWAEWQQRDQERMTAEIKEQLGGFFEGYTDAEVEAFVAGVERNSEQC